MNWTMIKDIHYNINMWNFNDKKIIVQKMRIMQKFTFLQIFPVNYKSKVWGNFFYK
jgi:hypothetical protein